MLRGDEQTQVQKCDDNLFPVIDSWKRGQLWDIRHQGGLHLLRRENPPNLLLAEETSQGELNMERKVKVQGVAGYGETIASPP